MRVHVWGMPWVMGWGAQDVGVPWDMGMLGDILGLTLAALWGVWVAGVICCGAIGSWPEAIAGWIAGHGVVALFSLEPDVRNPLAGRNAPCGVWG